MTSWAFGNWNFVFVGSKGAPESHCGKTDGALPTTNIAETPLIAEKPYIVQDQDGTFKLMKPNYETNKVGTTANWENAEEIDFSQVYVASSTDSASLINQKLAEGLHLLF